MEPQKLVANMQKRLFGMLAMLVTEFLLGMIINLFINFNNGFHGIGFYLLILHVIVGIGLLIGSVLVVVFASKINKVFNPFAWVGAISIWLAFIAGMLTAKTSLNGWSFVMALGFIAAIVVYGRLLYEMKGTN